MDLTSDHGWEKAIRGCDFVMNVASPFRIANPKNEDEMILSAIEGTIRVLKASQKEGVKRIILTSSIVSMMSSIRHGEFGPKDWSDLNYPNLSTYIKSKTLSERSTWDFINENKKISKMELVVIVPGRVFGPPLGTNISCELLNVINKMLNDKIPMVLNAAFPIVDVRDVAKLHLQALTNTKVAGKRFIALGTDPVGFIDIAQLLVNQGYKGPSTKKAPSWLLKLMSIFD